MAGFLNRALVGLGRIYNFVGGSAPRGDVELGLPVQLIHDVSRMAGLASGGYGYGPGLFLYAWDTGGASGNYNLNKSGKEILEEIGVPDPSNYTIWLHRVTSRISAPGGLTLLSVAVKYQGQSELPGNNTQEGMFLFYYGNSTATIVPGGSGVGEGITRSDGSDLEASLIGAGNPMPLSNTDLLVGRLETSLARTVNVLAYLSITPRGITPPGLY